MARKAAIKSAITATKEQIVAAVGTDDEALALVRINELGGALWLPDSLTAEQRHGRVMEAFQTLVEIAPQDGFERMLALQMIAAHHTAMECYRRANLPGQSLEGREQNLKHAEKLSATSSRLLETLNKHRGKGQQKVTVEHVYVEAGGQAIVGNVEVGGSTRSESAPRSLENMPAETIDPVPRQPGKKSAARRKW